MGKFGAFSFHGSKTITTGEGGMFVTNDKQFYERVLTLSNHGRAKNQKKQFWADMIGFKYKLSNLQAAIGCAQMERLNELIQKKQEILSKYKQQLEILNVVKMNPEPKGIINGAWMPTVVFDESTGVSREKIKASFDKENIDARVFFWPLSSLPMFDDSTQNVIARSVSSRAINLPSFHEITNDEIDRICQIIKKEVEVNL
jgi:perosamine synthetase